MVNKIKLMPEYGCYSIWISRDGGIFENVNPNKLSISKRLKSKIDILEGVYELTFDSSYPPDSGFKNRESEVSFHKEARSIVKEISEELPNFIVFYWLDSP